MSRSALFSTLVIVVLAIRFPLVSSQIVVAGRTWSILAAGTIGYDDYAMQADICHAYQILFKGEIKREDMIVFMADDIAYHPQNLEPGIIRHKVGGPDVYLGIPKDYAGENLTLNNFEAVLLGDKSLLVGGSGRVLLTNPQDRVFFYISTHGNEDVIQFGNDRLSSEHLYGMLIRNYLRQKYKSMVIYASTCHGGSMFLRYDNVYKDMNIYVMSAARHDQRAWKVSDSELHNASLGVQFGVVWMKDSEKHNRKKRTLHEQYRCVVQVKQSLVSTTKISDVTLYGNKDLSNQTLSVYHGYDPNGPR